MSKLRSGLILILALLISSPLMAQSNDSRSLAYGDVIGAVFGLTDTGSHDWQLDARAGDIVELTVRRIGGVFVPRLTLLAPDGSVITAIQDEADDYGQRLVFEGGLPVDGAYLVRVSRENDSTDGLVTQSEYSLSALYRGQVIADDLTVSVPASLTEDLPDYFGGEADSESFSGIDLYGNVSVTQPDPVTLRSRYIMSGALSLSLDNMNVVSRVIKRIAFTADGIALQNESGAVLVSSLDINNLALDGSIVEVTLADGRLIRTDFYAIERLIVLENTIAVRTSGGKALILDGADISLTRRGGITGEGPNAEPILVIQVDGQEIQSDVSAWYSLQVVDEQLTLSYPGGWSFQSDVLSGQFLQRGNQSRPDLDSSDLDTSILDWSIDDLEHSVSLVIDSRGLRGIQVDSGELALDFVDDRRVVDTLADLREVLISNRVARLERSNGTVISVLRDGTRVLSSGSVLDEGLRPQNFNNTGTYLNDYHPRVDMDFALYPVNQVNGNFHYSVQDYHVPGSALSLEWTRTYNSLVDDNQSPRYMQAYARSGNQWRHSYQIELDIRFVPTGEVRLILPDGSTHLFSLVDAGEHRYRSDSLLSWTIQQEGDFSGDWVAYRADGIQYNFDVGGRLQGITDSQGHVLLFSPAPRDYLTAFDAEAGFFVIDSYGRRIEVYTDASGLVQTVRGVQGRTIHYSYEDGRLVGVDYAGDYRAEYGYDENGYLNQIDDVNSPYAHRMAIDYSADGQVNYTINYPEAEQPERYDFRYEDNSTIQSWRVTGNNNPNDNRSTILEYDSDYRITSWTLPDGMLVYRWGYRQTTGLLSEIRQPDLSELRLNYDEWGYLQQFTDPLFGSSTGIYTLSYEDGAQFTRRLIQIDTPDATAQTTMTYDGMNRLIERNQLVSGSGSNRQIYQTRYLYNGRGELAQVIEPGTGDDRRITAFEYDSFGYPLSIHVQSDSSSVPVQHWQLTHDAVGRLLQIVDIEDAITSLQWDNDRNRIVSLDVGAESYRYRYDNDDNLIAYSAPGIRETYRYDGANRLIALINGLDLETLYGYDSAGNVIGITRPDGHGFTYQYNDLDQLIQVTGMDGLETRYQLNINQESNRSTYVVTNPLNEAVHYQFDPLGRLRLVTDFDREGNQTFSYNLTYNARGNPTEIVDGRGRSLRVRYDFTGHPLVSSINNSLSTTYTYNEAGLLQTLTDPGGYSIQYDYDEAGNIVHVVLPDGSEQAYAYDSAGSLLSFSDANGAITTYDYDSANRLIAETDPLGIVTGYAYDEAGNLLRVIDPRSGTEEAIETVYRYDALNRPVEWINAEGAITRYVYDVDGNLTELIEAGGLQTSFTYDPSHHVVALTQPDDREFLYGRDSAGRIISETNPSGQTTVFSYNIIGKIGRIIDPRGSVQSFSWFGDGRLVRYALSSGSEFEYISDSAGRLIEIVNLGEDEIHAINTRFEYDDNGNIITIRQGNRATIESSNAVIHRYSYDSAGRVVSYRPPASSTPYSFEYDLAGNLIRQVSPDGIESQFIYDPAGNITERIVASNTDTPVQESYLYDSAGNIIRLVTDDGLIREYDYDGLNRLIAMREISGDIVREHAFEYDASGHVTRYLNPRGLETIYRYDLFGNPVAIEQSRNIEGETVTLTTRYAYDALDNLIERELPGGQTIVMTYNGTGQRVRYVDALANSYAFSYDSAGNIAQISDPSGNSTGYEFDISNRLSQMIFPSRAVIDFSYDSPGNLNRVLLPETSDVEDRERVNYGFDTAGNLISINHQGNQITLLSRDDAGRVISIQTPDGATIQQTYDVFGHINSIQANGQTISRAYDPSGRPLELSNDDEIYRIAYDAFGDMTTFDWLEPAPDEESDETLRVAVRYEHDISGNIILRDAGDYGLIRYDYDAFERPVYIQMDNQWASIEYNANGWRTFIRRSNGVQTSYSYDLNGRVRSIAHVNADNQRLDGYAYEYDAGGNIIRVTRGDNQAILYTYDVTQQLLSERWLDEENQIIYSVNYSYDDAGNRIEQTVRFEGENQSRTLFEYNNRNQLVSETRNVAIDIEDRFALPVSIAMLFTLPLLFFARRRPRYIVLLLLSIPLQVLAWQPDLAESVSYDYDTSGNLLTERYEDGGQITYGYDDFNRLIAVEIIEPDGISRNETTIRYNVMGRIAEITGTGLESETQYQFIYDAQGLIAVRDVIAGTVQRYFSPIPGETFLVTGEESAFWMMDDGIGQLSRLVDENGQPDGNMTGFSHNAFHAIVSEDSIQDVNPATDFVEQFYLRDADILLMGVRAYHPRLGRFLQRDPVRHDPRGNLYTYAYNSPTNYSDPTGMTADPAFEGIDPDILIIDSAEFIKQPGQFDIPLMPDVAQLQSDENHRILDMAYTAQYQLNDVAFYPAPSGCDIYLRTANPLDEQGLMQSGNDYRAMLDLYATDGDWLPASHPAIGRNPVAMNQLMQVNQLLSLSLQGGQVLSACPQSFALPSIPQVTVSDFYDDLGDMRDLLDEISLYPAIPTEMPSLTATGIIDPLAPQITTISINPAILPSIPGQIQNLQEDTQGFYQDLLLPVMPDMPFNWQDMNHARDVAPVSGISINN